MQIIETPIKGLLEIQPKVFGDNRGFFLETWQKERYQTAGIDYEFVQDNRSFSTKGTLRGLHFQKQFPQGKLVSVILGEVFDVAVDLRKDSETFSKWYGVTLTGENAISYGSRRVLLMAFMYFLKSPILNINVRIIIIPRMKADCCGTMRY